MKINLAVFFGCRSVEHEISIISAVQAMHAVDKNKYNIVPVYITKSGEIFTGDSLLDIDNYKDINNLLKQCNRAVILRENNEVVLKTQGKSLFKSKSSVILHTAFPVVHGSNCEDGTLQGFLEILGLPYIGCDVLSSAVGMDKVVFKSVMQSASLPVLPCITFYSREWVINKENITNEISEKIGFPLILKPVNLGSSVGISKVDDAEHLEAAVTLAMSFTDKLLAERAITSLREINCSVLGDYDKCESSVCEEPIMKDEILSYKDKYMSNSSSKGMSSLSRKLPADLSGEKSNEIRELTEKVFKVLGGSGIARIDFLLDTADNDKVYINEINTIPGSLAFYLWEATGISYTELIDRLVEIASRRTRNRANLMRSIDTNILSSDSFGFKGSKN